MVSDYFFESKAINTFEKQKMIIRNMILVALVELATAKLVT